MKDAAQAPENKQERKGHNPDAEAGKQPAPAMPAAGPHADPDLTDAEKTPGAGSLPDPDKPNAGDATTG